MSKPLIVYFDANDSANFYELTPEQFDKLEQADEWDTIEKFKYTNKEPTYSNTGYAPVWLEELAEIYGFEVRSI